MANNDFDNLFREITPTKKDVFKVFSIGAAVYIGAAILSLGAAAGTVFVVIKVAQFALGQG